MAQTDVEVLYCYRCGKHVKRGPGKCWYCSAVTHRPIRPLKTCSFCRLTIPQKAIKCHHCGEFVDGRPRPEEQAAAGPNITFVIDKAVIGGDQSLMLPGGRQLPEDTRGYLTDQTAKAIATNSPALIDQPGIKALPAPPSDAPPVPEGAAPSAAAGGNYAVVPLQASSQVPVRPVQEGGGDLVRAGDGPEKIPFLKAWRKKPEKKEEEKPKDPEEERYRTCSVCLTEVLAADNYCFHCGTLQRPEARGRSMGKASGPLLSNTAYYGLSLLLMAAYVFVGLRFDKVPYAGTELSTGPLILGLSGVALLLLVVAFFRRRSSFSQIVTLVLLAGWLASTLVALFGRSFY